MEPAYIACVRVTRSVRHFSSYANRGANRSSIFDDDLFRRHPRRGVDLTLAVRDFETTLLHVRFGNLPSVERNICKWRKPLAKRSGLDRRRRTDFSFWSNTALQGITRLLTNRCVGREVHQEPLHMNPVGMPCERCELRPHFFTRSVEEATLGRVDQRAHRQRNS